MEKISPKFQKTVQSKQSLNRRKFAESGQPEQKHVLIEKFLRRSDVGAGAASST
jgi:hypothetical protein